MAVVVLAKIIFFEFICSLVIKLTDFPFRLGAAEKIYEYLFRFQSLRNICDSKNISARILALWNL